MPKEQVGSLYKKTPEASKWTGAFTDPFDGRRIVKTLYTDKRASRAKLDEMIRSAERQATGIGDRYEEHRQTPILDHVRDYLSHCRHVGESVVHQNNKKTQLERLVAGIQAKRLGDLEPNRVGKYLAELSSSGRARCNEGDDPGLSARSVNMHRTTAVSFVEWCVRQGRCPDNPLSIVSKLDERKDTRRRRRAFTVKELARLFEADRGRGSLYKIAVYTGLRKGELAELSWGDIDLPKGYVRVRIDVGKAAREDHIPIHAEAANVFRAIRPEAPTARTRVFETMPTSRTFRRDLERAKINRLDDEGRSVDFHALRTTTGTMLARHGVTPQITARIMRHSDVKITMKHYTDLRLHDLTRGIGELPRIDKPEDRPETEQRRATGTTDATPLARPEQQAQHRSVTKPLPAPVPTPVVATEGTRDAFDRTKGTQLDGRRKGPKPVAPGEAQRARDGAEPVNAVQSADEDASPIPFPAGSGQGAQPRYTSRLGSGVQHPAEEAEATDAKSSQGKDIRAISAVG